MKIIDSGVMTGTATVYSVKADLFTHPRFSLQVSWTGTPTGTATYWASNKDNPLESSDADWVAVTLSGTSNPAGSASGFIVADVTAGYRWFRVKYVNASSTGVLDAWLSIKKA